MKCLYLNGYSVAMLNGLPDMGFVTMTERSYAFGAVGGSVEEAIWRGRADAGVDLVWCELPSSDRTLAIKFAKGTRAAHPNLPLAFKYSSSMKWHQDFNELEKKHIPGRSADRYKASDGVGEEKKPQE